MQRHEQHINLHATPEMMAGVYANFANVSHSDYEFSITFVRLDHESEEDEKVDGVVVSARQHVAPLHEGAARRDQDNYASGRRRENIKNLPETPPDVH